MLINYRKPDGRRTTITLSNALIDTWYATIPFGRDEGTEPLELLVKAIEETPHRDNGTTFVHQVECHLFADIREHINSLELRAFSLESEKDGV
jgi:hypothetical protein